MEVSIITVKFVYHVPKTKMLNEHHVNIVLSISTTNDENGLDNVVTITLP